MHLRRETIHEFELLQHLNFAKYIIRVDTLLLYADFLFGVAKGAKKYYASFAKQKHLKP